MKIRLKDLKCPSCGGADFIISQTHMLRRQYTDGMLVRQHMKNIESLKNSTSGGLFTCLKCSWSGDVREVIEGEG